MSSQADAIVVAYRSTEVIEVCVRSLRADPAVGTVIVVNNSPGDGTELLLRDITDVRYVESPENVGFGRAVNAARAYVRRPFVVLANPDARQDDPATTTKLVAFARAVPAAAVVAPGMVDRHGALDCNSQRDITLLRELGESRGWPSPFRLRRSRSDHQRAHVTEYAIGSFLLCRVAALDAVGWFDEDIFLFGEDIDLCRRLRREGGEVWFAAVGQVTHLSGHSWRQLPAAASQKLFRASKYRELRHAGHPVQAGLYRFLIGVRDGPSARPETARSTASIGSDHAR